MQHCDYFDYWGKGTEVTVSSTVAASPTVFPLVPCLFGSSDTITVGCLAQDFYPKSLTFQWTTNAAGTTPTSVQYPPVEKSNKYTGVSLLQVPKSDWNSRRTFNCSVTHNGIPKIVTLQKVESKPPKVTLLAVPAGDTQVLVCTIEDFSSAKLFVKWKTNQKDITGLTELHPQTSGPVNSAVSFQKVSKADWDSNTVYTCEVVHKGETYMKKTASAALITVALDRPSAKKIHLDNQAEWECIITGTDRQVVNEVQINWQINGENVAGDAGTVTQSGTQYHKNSKLIRNLTEWQSDNKVRCSATKDDMTPVIQEVTVRKGDESKPKLISYVHLDDDSDDVTLVCLVSSAELQDYYIAWAESVKQNPTIDTDGINIPAQKTKNGYVVASTYTTTKDKWNSDNMYSCYVWPAGSENFTALQQMSKVKNDKCFSLDSDLCVVQRDDAYDVEDYCSLWSTAASFIFLFISSVLFNFIFSLAKMKSL